MHAFYSYICRLFLRSSNSFHISAHFHAHSHACGHASTVHSEYLFLTGHVFFIRTRKRRFYQQLCFAVVPVFSPLNGKRPREHSIWSAIAARGNVAGSVGQLIRRTTTTVYLPTYLPTFAVTPSPPPPLSRPVRFLIQATRFFCCPACSLDCPSSSSMAWSWSFISVCSTACTLLSLSPVRPGPF